MLRYLPIPHSQHSYLPQHDHTNGSEQATNGRFWEMRNETIPVIGLDGVVCSAASGSGGQGVPMARKIRGRT